MILPFESKFLFQLSSKYQQRLYYPINKKKYLATIDEDISFDERIGTTDKQ